MDFTLRDPQTNDQLAQVHTPADLRGWAWYASDLGLEELLVVGQDFSETLRLKEVADLARSLLPPTHK